MERCRHIGVSQFPRSTATSAVKCLRHPVRLNLYSLATKTDLLTRSYFAYTSGPAELRRAKKMDIKRDLPKSRVNLEPYSIGDGETFWCRLY